MYVENCSFFRPQHITLVVPHPKQCVRDVDASEKLRNSHVSDLNCLLSVMFSDSLQ